MYVYVHVCGYVYKIFYLYLIIIESASNHFYCTPFYGCIYMCVCLHASVGVCRCVCIRVSPAVYRTCGRMIPRQTAPTMMVFRSSQLPKPFKQPWIKILSITMVFCREEAEMRHNARSSGCSTITGVAQEIS